MRKMPAHRAIDKRRRAPQMLKKSDGLFFYIFLKYRPGRSIQASGHYFLALTTSTNGLLV